MAQDSISECAITAYLKDILGDNFTVDPTNPPKLHVSNSRGFMHGNNLIVPNTKSVAFNASAEATISVIETASVGEKMQFNITIPDGRSIRNVMYEPAVIPNEATKDLNEIAKAKSFDYG